MLFCLFQNYGMHFHKDNLLLNTVLENFLNLNTISIYQNIHSLSYKNRNFIPQDLRKQSRDIHEIQLFKILHEAYGLSSGCRNIISCFYDICDSNDEKLAVVESKK